MVAEGHACIETGVREDVRSLDILVPTLLPFPQRTKLAT
tara:strand:+ start:49 stop:165 length:117 start_codon:yes stop_codon:yes gene_type:complete